MGLSCHRPEIDQAHRLHARGLHRIHRADAVGFGLQFRVEHRQTPGPVALVGFELPEFVHLIAKVEREL